MATRTPTDDRQITAPSHVRGVQDPRISDQRAYPIREDRDNSLLRSIDKAISAGFKVATDMRIEGIQEDMLKELEGTTSEAPAAEPAPSFAGGEMPNADPNLTAEEQAAKGEMEAQANSLIAAIEQGADRNSIQLRQHKIGASYLKRYPGLKSQINSAFQLGTGSSISDAGMAAFKAQQEKAKKIEEDVNAGLDRFGLLKLGMPLKERVTLYVTKVEPRLNDLKQTLFEIDGNKAEQNLRGPGLAMRYSFAVSAAADKVVQKYGGADKISGLSGDQKIQYLREIDVIERDKVAGYAYSNLPLADDAVRSGADAIIKKPLADARALADDAAAAAIYDNRRKLLEATSLDKELSEHPDLVDTQGKVAALAWATGDASKLSTPAKAYAESKGMEIQEDMLRSSTSGGTDGGLRKDIKAGRSVKEFAAKEEVRAAMIRKNLGNKETYQVLADTLKARTDAFNEPETIPPIVFARMIEVFGDKEFPKFAEEVKLGVDAETMENTKKGFNYYLNQRKDIIRSKFASTLSVDIHSNTKVEGNTGVPTKAITAVRDVVENAQNPNGDIYFRPKKGYESSYQVRQVVKELNKNAGQLNRLFDVANNINYGGKNRKQAVNDILSTGGMFPERQYSAEQLAPKPAPATKPAPKPAPKAVPDGATATQQDMLEIGDQYGARATSLTRTPEKNAEVGGVANSRHLTGEAVDFVGVKDKEGFTADMTARGYKVIDEGDHLHVQNTQKKKEAKPSYAKLEPGTYQDEATGQVFVVNQDGSISKFDLGATNG